MGVHLRTNWQIKPNGAEHQPIDDENSYLDQFIQHYPPEQVDEGQTISLDIAQHKLVLIPTTGTPTTCSLDLVFDPLHLVTNILIIGQSRVVEVHAKDVYCGTFKGELISPDQNIYRVDIDFFDDPKRWDRVTLKVNANLASVDRTLVTCISII